MNLYYVNHTKKIIRKNHTEAPPLTPPNSCEIVLNILYLNGLSPMCKEPHKNIKQKKH